MAQNRIHDGFYRCNRRLCENGLRSPTATLMKDMKIEGGILKFIKFLSLFKNDPLKSQVE